MNRLFAIGDVHGCFDNLKLLIEKRLLLNKADKLVLLGDYIDRGPQSKAVVDYLLNLKSAGFDVIALRGNHEALLLDAYTDERNLPKWLQNGGHATLQSFEVDSPRQLSPHYLDFFQKLPYYYAQAGYLFVHAGFNDKILNPFSDTTAMLWSSQKSYQHHLFADKTIVHGHKPLTVSQCAKQLSGQIQVINIDTACVIKGKSGYGQLTAIELHSKQLYSV